MKKFCILLSIVVAVCFLSGCGGSSPKSDSVSSDNQLDFFSSPKDYIGSSASFSGKIVSEPIISGGKSHFNVMMIDNNADSIVQVESDNQDVQLFYIVAFTGKVIDAIDVTNEYGTHSQGVVSADNVSIIDASQAQ